MKQQANALALLSTLSTLFALAAWDLYRGNPVLVLAGLTVATLLFSLGLR